MTTIHEAGPIEDVELDDDLKFKRLVYEGLVITIEAQSNDEAKRAQADRCRAQWVEWFFKDYLNE